jgi:hypothetical protein
MAVRLLGYQKAVRRFGYQKVALRLGYQKAARRIGYQKAAGHLGYQEIARCLGYLSNEEAALKLQVTYIRHGVHATEQIPQILELRRSLGIIAGKQV